TWPITFSYAVGSYSTRRGLGAGVTFSLAFAAQQALASELAYLGLAHWFTFEGLDEILYLIVGVIMLAAGLFVMGRGALPHLHLPGLGPRGVLGRLRLYRFRPRCVRLSGGGGIRRHHSAPNPRSSRHRAAVPAGIVPGRRNRGDELRDRDPGMAPARSRRQCRSGDAEP